VRPPKAPVDARPGRSGRTCPRAGWTPASSTPAGNRCCRRPNSTSLEDENALRHSPAHLGADGDRGGLFAMGRRTVGERTADLGAAAEGSRGRTTRPKRPHLPEGWLDSRVFDPSGKSLLSEAELDISGG